MGPWITLAVVLLPLGLIAVFAAVSHLRNAGAPPSVPTTTRARADPVSEREFVDAIAHDLRSPLSAILGYQELLADGLYGPLDPAALEPVRRIGTSAQRVERMLAGLTEFVRDRGLAPDLLLDTLDPEVAIRDGLQRVSELAAERGVTLLSRDTESLPSLRTDAGRFRAALDVAFESCIRSSPSARLAVAAVAEPAALHLEIEGTAFAPSAFIPAAVADFAAPTTDSHRVPSLPLGILRALLLRLGGTVELLPPTERGLRTLRLRFPQLPR